MAKTTYSSLKLKINNEVKAFDFNGNTIEVSQYLPVDDKYALVNITLQESKEGAIYNPVKKDMYFHLNLVYMYTNITFTDKQREDESKLYDTIVSNGLLTQILENIPDSEYEVLYSYIEELEEDTLNYKNTVSGAISEIIENLPIRADEMQKIIDNFNPEQFQNVLNFAKSVNGDRDIK